jgi:hypothetical protein
VKPWGYKLRVYGLLQMAESVHNHLIVHTGVFTNALVCGFEVEWCLGSHCPPAPEKVAHMSMKKTDLEKSKALRLTEKMKKAAIPGRFAEGAGQVLDRREQRKLDQAAGLVPFAAKLHADLVKQMREMAEADGVSINEVAERVIRAGLSQVETKQ